MGTRVAARQILRCAVRSVTSSVSRPLQPGRGHLQSACTQCRYFCCSSNQKTVQHSHELSPPSGNPVTELSLRSLTDMGFTDTQAEQVYQAVCSVRGGSATKHALPMLTALLVLGLNPTSVLKMLVKCPELYAVKEAQLQQRISHLRKLGVVEGSIQRMVAHYPKILAVPVKTLKHVVMFLKEKCLFTSQQVMDILRDSPAVVTEDLDQLEYKFQYVYFRMGVKQAEMVKCRLFRITLDEVRFRHSFLERRGQYHTPDKKGQTIIINPKLNKIINLDQNAFLTHVAQASAEEYDVFQTLLARECQEEELRRGRIEADDDGDDDSYDYADEDEDDEEDEETLGKSGYSKRRKK